LSRQFGGTLTLLAHVLDKLRASLARNAFMLCMIFLSVLKVGWLC
jgi:hypothetical protein